MIGVLFYLLLCTVIGALCGSGLAGLLIGVGVIVVSIFCAAIWDVFDTWQRQKRARKRYESLSRRRVS